MASSNESVRFVRETLPGDDPSEGVVPTCCLSDEPFNEEEVGENEEEGSFLGEEEKEMIYNSPLAIAFSSIGRTVALSSLLEELHERPYDCRASINEKLLGHFGLSLGSSLWGGPGGPQTSFKTHRARERRAKQGKIAKFLYAIPQVTELENEEQSRGKLQIILYTQFFKAQEYSKAFKAKIESFVKDTIKLALTNFGTPSRTTLPFISSLHQRRNTLHGYSRKSCEVVNSKLAISKSSSSSTKSVGVTTRNMSKKLKESSQMSPLAYYSFTTNVASVMVTNATTIGEQLASLTRAIEGLTKYVQEQDAQIARLINKADNIDASHVMGKQVEANDEVETPIKKHYTENDKYAKEIQVSSNGLIPMDQLKEFIEGTIKRSREAQGTYGDHLVKQFVRSLKENAFDWYTNLDASSIDGWE
ncbi:hypothetical protein Sango_1914700 [Sesamum angolense]|uniref:Uncharacterized protein n=1 Tax=Sesamum angolense TaxID=2727404 RepID=A0AAE2BN02_9LAMI|nr:hypothetical protein Sango_1914700 [Sesamum angolense]